MTLEISQFYQDNRHQYPQSIRLRIHRALSWLEQAERSDDLDSRFIFLWIAFNAIYANDLSHIRNTDKGAFVEFLYRICQFDVDSKIYHLIWNTYSGNIRVLLDNRYTFQPFWDYQNGLISERAWQEDFELSQKKAYNALASKDTVVILTALFSHIYTLRNQIVHGGATHHSSVNRQQVKDACAILSRILPFMIEIILQNADRDWGKPFYPVVQD
ncbi:HEPN domain-containing protein [Moraxella nasicaprae]|uniref:Apea-like HEPN domain-containing protein n=1 Tax=Moraxella nasicaprae TaxID=2904122 RepID=A0ABY6F451_9GAMM|nr:HEPN domain-containing protein [Moraxella nasicaprae]UXZ04670.1 hypothetical protein LU297_08900 [Moraxella nasicaprae]